MCLHTVASFPVFMFGALSGSIALASSKCRGRTNDSPGPPNRHTWSGKALSLLDVLAPTCAPGSKTNAS